MFASLSLVAGNEAYRYSSVAFLQMMKEANLILIYIMSLAVALPLPHGSGLRFLSICLT